MDGPGKLNTLSPNNDKQMMKQATIMEAMQGLVHQYGYAKVTMDDIAKESGLSRPALYQFFRNKQEIYRAIARQMFQSSLEKIDAVLASDLPAEEQIVEAIMDGKLRMLSEMEATRHGAELLDLGNELSADLIEQFTRDLLARFQSVFLQLMGPAQENKAEQMAQNLIFWLEGMKAQVRDLDKREALLRDFVAMQFKAIGA